MEQKNDLSKARFAMDLSNASVIEIIDAYTDFKRRRNSHYSAPSIRSIIAKMEREMGQDVYPSDVTDFFYSTFIQWLCDTGHRYSTIRSYCDQLRCLLFWASKHGCKLTRTYDQYKVPAYFKSRLALTQDEISHIAHFNVRLLDMNPQKIRTLERVRDTFVLCCNLGQRYSDIIRIGPENFQRNFFRTLQQKTGAKAIVDIDRYSILPEYTYHLLERYDYHSPYKSTCSNFNRYLHELLQIIGDEFTETITSETKVDGKMHREAVPKWQLCTSHTGRRSFITFNVLRCPTEAEVRKCSGHTTGRSFEKYISFGE